VGRIVRQIRAQRPKVRILLGADSGFAREDHMAWREENRVDYLFGVAKNDRLIAKIERELTQAAGKSRRTGRAARYFKDFMWSTLDSWSRGRRVVAKAKHIRGQLNPRFVVTPAEESRLQGPISLPEDLLCSRRHGKPHQRVSD